MIIEVDGGRYEKLDVVAQAVKDKKTFHPVLWDEECRNTERYGVSAWPVAYLIGTDGRVVWEGNPQRIVSRKKPHQQLMKLVEAELAKVTDSVGGAKEQQLAKQPNRQSPKP